MSNCLHLKIRQRESAGEGRGGEGEGRRGEGEERGRGGEGSGKSILAQNWLFSNMKIVYIKTFGRLKGSTKTDQ